MTIRTADESLFWMSGTFHRFNSQNFSLIPDYLVHGVFSMLRKF